ncbi:hypothetical protein PVAP13_8KG317612 [Panicum virgatum]|uniref:Reverse transcriptase zinc-binding domain-containing protein n=1 Tax=Panicum virgatum TaxID=38727 RepID=A0A8T0PRI2_PANVG|nr:hypothetical protein PVAP13_8KG317612 [Panicum virgatum]
MEDEIIWRWTSDGEYTTKSAYRIHFIPKHFCKDCLYTCAVWDQLVNWLNLHQLPASNSVSSIYRWWKKCRAMVAKDSKSFFDGLVIYFWWNIWKERIRRTFR